MSIASLKLLVERLFKVRVARQVLALRLPHEDNLRSLGRDDTQSLAFFDTEVIERSLLHHPSRVYVIPWPSRP